MDVDPLASMRCWSIQIELGGRTFDIPALSALDWWPVLATGDFTSILDTVVSDPAQPFDLDDLLLEGRLTQAELGEALTDALEAAAGRSRHAAVVLARAAEMHWPSINGSLVRRGFRWEGQPLGAALDAVYAEMTSRLDEKGLEKFDALLSNEALTKGKPSDRQREKLAGEFESFAGPRPTTGVRSTAGQSGSERPRTRTRPRPPRQADPSTEPMQPPEPRG